MADWKAIRRHNRKASARKAKRARLEFERKAMHERLGGAVNLAELKAARREIRRIPGGYNCPFDCEVWHIRGREWRLQGLPNPECPVAILHVDHRTDLDHRRGWVPLTPAARKWLLAEWLRAEEGGAA